MKLEQNNALFLCFFINRQNKTLRSFRIILVMLMKFRFIIPMIGAVLLGYFCGKFVFQGYELDKTVFEDNGMVYFLQQGVYSSKESMEQNVANLSEYLYQEENGKFYVYFGITSKEENANKVKELYAKENINIYIKPMPMSNQDFINNLIQYDILLSSSDTLLEVDSVLKAILSSYREFVLEK